MGRLSRKPTPQGVPDLDLGCMRHNQNKILLKERKKEKEWKNAASMYNKPVCFTWLTLCLGLHLAFWPHELPICNGGSRCHECMGLEGEDPTQANTKIGQKKRASNLTERASAVDKHHVPFSPPSQFGVCLCGHQARDAPAPWGSGRLPFFSLPTGQVAA